MVDYIEKWNKYTIGGIEWINSTRSHVARVRYMQYVMKSNGIKTVLEIGAGECIEAKILYGLVDYTVMDISDTFLDHAKTIGLKTIKNDMVEIPENINKKYDLVFASCVLEHSPDIKKTVELIKALGKRYYITMFRWAYNKNTKSDYSNNRKMYTSSFDINEVFKMFGNVQSKTVITKVNEVDEYSRYEKTIDKTKKEHRTGTWLSFYGNCND